MRLLFLIGMEVCFNKLIANIYLKFEFHNKKKA